MEETFVPFRGIKNDLKERLLCYKQDWTGGFRAGIRFVTFIAHICSCMEYTICSYLFLLNKHLSEVYEHHYYEDYNLFEVMLVKL